MASYTKYDVNIADLISALQNAEETLTAVKGKLGTSKEGLTEDIWKSVVRTSTVNKMDEIDAKMETLYDSINAYKKVVADIKTYNEKCARLDFAEKTLNECQAQLDYYNGFSFKELIILSSIAFYDSEVKKYSKMVTDLKDELSTLKSSIEGASI